MLTQGHVLAKRNGKDTSQVFQFSFFLCWIHAKELMYINYACYINLLYKIGNMKNQSHPGAHNTFDVWG